MVCKDIMLPGIGPTMLGLLILLEKSIQNIFNELTQQIMSVLFELLHYTNTQMLAI